MEFSNQYTIHRRARNFYTDVICDQRVDAFIDVMMAAGKGDIFDTVRVRSAPVQ